MYGISNGLGRVHRCIKHTSFHHSLKSVGNEDTRLGLALKLTIDIIHQFELCMGIESRCLGNNKAKLQYSGE